MIVAHPESLTWRGYWRALEQYRAGDLVNISGTAYVCMKDHRARWWRRPHWWSRRNWVVMLPMPRQRTVAR